MKITDCAMTEDQWNNGGHTLITSSGGLVFEGTKLMFQDCFFDNADWPNVVDWCQKEGFTIEKSSLSGSSASAETKGQS